MSLLHRLIEPLPPSPISRPTQFAQVWKQQQATTKLGQAAMTGGPGGATGAAAKDKGGKGKAKGPVSGLVGVREAGSIRQCAVFLLAPEKGERRWRSLASDGCV